MTRFLLRWCKVTSRLLVPTLGDDQCYRAENNNARKSLVCSTDTICILLKNYILPSTVKIYKISNFLEENEMLNTLGCEQHLEVF